MAKEKISGTPEQVMQVLADRIGNLTTRQEELGYEVIAHKTAIAFVLAALRSLDGDGHARLRNMLESQKKIYEDFAADPSAHFPERRDDAERLAGAFSIMANQFADIIRDGEDGKPTAPTFTVIPGGKEID